MSMLSDILPALGSGLSSVISGGLTGIFGVAVQRFADFKNKELDLVASREKMSHELDMRHADASIMEKEASSRIQIAEINGSTAIVGADSESMKASYALEPQQYTKSAMTVGQTWMFTILDFVRGLVRPSLTLYLAAFATFIYFNSVSIANKDGVSFSGPEAFSLVEQTTNTILYLFTTCSLWYFGVQNRASEAASRQKQK